MKIFSMNKFSQHSLITEQLRKIETYNGGYKLVSCYRQKHGVRKRSVVNKKPVQYLLKLRTGNDSL